MKFESQKLRTKEKKVHTPQFRGVDADSCHPFVSRNYFAILSHHIKPQHQSYQAMVSNATKA